MAGEKRKNTKKKKKKAPLDRHYLYSAAVQSTEADIDFLRRVYRTRHKRSPLRLREDFCGTAVLACDWVRRNKFHEAWGVDLDRQTLEWGRERFASRLGDDVDRLHLQCRNVLEPAAEPVDVVAAFNFSYSVFKTREQLGAYFKVARESLRPGGLMVLDAWGGTEVMSEDVEERRIDAETAFDGTEVPSFTYVWEQASFNPVTHDIKCNIHFRLKDGTKMKRAFSYDWRLWTLPELQELLTEAGFEEVRVYVEGWDDEEDDTDGIFRRRKRFDNQGAWVAYVVGLA